MTKIKSLPDSRLKGLSITDLKIIDGSTIQLFSELLRGVGRNPKDSSRKRGGGIKVHTLMDAFNGVAEFVRMTGSGSMTISSYTNWIYRQTVGRYLIRQAYNVYQQFSKWMA